MIWKRHLVQLIKAGDFYRDPEQEFDTNDSDRVTIHQGYNKERVFTGM